MGLLNGDGLMCNRSLAAKSRRYFVTALLGAALCVPQLFYPATARADIACSVYLYGPGGAYLAYGYSVTNGGSVLDPSDIAIGTEANGIITANGVIIGYIVLAQ